MVMVVSVVFSVAAEIGLFFSPHTSLFLSTLRITCYFMISYSLLQKPFVIFHVQLEYCRVIGKCFMLLAGYFTSMFNSWEINMYFLFSSKNVHQYLFFNCQISFPHPLSCPHIPLTRDISVFRQIVNSIAVDKRENCGTALRWAAISHGVLQREVVQREMCCSEWYISLY